jgi:hypothetical protein
VEVEDPGAGIDRGTTFLGKVPGVLGARGWSREPLSATWSSGDRLGARMAR